MFQPELDVGFATHRPDIDDLFQSEDMRGNTGVDGVREFDILLLIGLDHGGGVNSGGGAEGVVTDYGIIHRDRNAGRIRHGFAIRLELGKVLLIPGRDAHEFQVD